MQKQLTFLALGDSYTIGEAVPLQKSFPYQTVQQLRRSGWNFVAPEIVAQTGWTTEDLKKSMEGYTFLPAYDVVSVLIGVNNQYQGRPLAEYEEHFEAILQEAIRLAGGQNKRVLVVSIPDYGVTPFAQKLEPAKIEAEIDMFNKTAFLKTQAYKTGFVDITLGSREAKNYPDLLASDGLHPSAKEYNKWAVKLTAFINDILSA